MDEDCIELTSYLREGDRADRKFLGKALLGLYGRNQTLASILLGDTAVAVDTCSHIEALLGEALQMTGSRPVTVGHSRLLTGDIEPFWLSEDPGEATRLTAYCAGRDRVYQVPAFEVACELLYRRGIGRAAVLSGTDGTARGRRLRSRNPLARSSRRDSEAPLVVIAVDSGDMIGKVLPELGGLFRSPVMTITRVRLCKRDGQLICRPQSASDRASGMAAQVKLAVYTDEAERHDGQPVHRAIARGLRTAGISGTVTQPGILGFHGDHAPGDYLPVVTTVIGGPERISAAFDVIDPLTMEYGLVTCETVRYP